jgi:hypothetical protein
MDNAACLLWSQCSWQVSQSMRHATDSPPVLSAVGASPNPQRDRLIMQLRQRGWTHQRIGKRVG